MKNYKELANNDAEFQKIIEPLIMNETVQQMKNYKQHYDTTCFEHCYMASYYCYLILYDWRKRQPDRKGLHAFTHGKTACENACKLFDLNDKEKDIIIKHMWPVTLSLPKSREAFILTFVDKYCAISESFEVYSSRLLNKKAFRYTYLALCLLFIKI